VTASRPFPSVSTWGIAFGLWTIPALIDVAAVYVISSRAGDSFEPLAAFARHFPKWWLWAALTPLIWRLDVLLPIDGPRRGRALLTHGFASAGFTVLHLALLAIYYGAPGILAESIRRTVTNYFAIDVWAYWAMLALHAAVRLQRLSRERQLAASRLESSLVRARLDALQMQLQPHFLFNTLNALSGLIRTGRGAEAIDVLTDLGHLLRSSLQDGSDLVVPLEDELEFVERYLEIEKIRLGERLDFEFDVESSMLHTLVPRFVLQPLVENAIRHGIERGARRVIVRCRRDGARLRIEVRDDGWRERSPVGSGVGLTNVRARLDLLYGPAASLEVGPARPRGFEAVVTLPVGPEPEQEA
jgi:signal transduction histidine kinase